MRTGGVPPGPPDSTRHMHTHTHTHARTHHSSAPCALVAQVNADFGSIFSTLLPGTTAKLEPQEGRSFLEGGLGGEGGSPESLGGGGNSLEAGAADPWVLLRRRCWRPDPPPKKNKLSHPHMPPPGLEVRVAFGGVWKESLSELSGGQKSLLALSLILAMLRFKPAPIYILDEVRRGVRRLWVRPGCGACGCSQVRPGAAPVCAGAGAAGRRRRC